MIVTTQETTVSITDTTLPMFMTLDGHHAVTRLPGLLVYVVPPGHEQFQEGIELTFGA